MADNNKKQPNIGGLLIGFIIAGFIIGFGICFITFKVLGGN